MKTAKELCEEIKNNEMSTILQKLIDQNGRVTIRNYYRYYNSKIEVGDPYKEYEKALKNKSYLEELGYKVEVNHLTLTSPKMREVKEKLFGLIPITTDEEYFEPVEVSEITISACCGE